MGMTIPSFAEDHKAYFRSSKCTPRDAIFCAIGIHDNMAVSRIIAKGGNVNQAGPVDGYLDTFPGMKSIDDDLPLCLATRVGNIDAVRLLLANKARVNEKCALGRALTQAAGYGQEAIIILLIQHGANPNLADDNGYSPLMAAADGPDGTWQQGPNNRAKQRRIATILLKAGADPTYTTSEDAWSKGQTVFTRIRYAGDMKMASMLRAAKKKWLAKNGKGSDFVSP
jgi:hypothetical protein